MNARRRVNSDVSRPRNARERDSPFHESRRRSIEMTPRISRRNLLHGGGIAAAVAALASGGARNSAFAQTAPARNLSSEYKEDLFYREDWLGEPWRKPETVVLIHGAEGSSTE